MDPIKLSHNPRCSKSRATLALLEENDINPEIVYYLETPPSSEELTELLTKLGIGIKNIIRTSEPEYGELGLDDESLSEPIVFDIVCKHPKLIQRPIVVKGEKAILGRPPENVFNLLNDGG
ncbi:MAG: arsenate reductase (glutaredoxin) [Gammaproteobacteria bacterium]|nr:arsenate reductase (glutaredoxin) [Gammaproteobacteria bacterium]